MVTLTIPKHSQLNKRPPTPKSRMELRKYIVITDNNFEPKRGGTFDALQPMGPWKFFFWRGKVAKKWRERGKVIWNSWPQPTLSQTLIDLFGVSVPLLRHKRPFWAPRADLLARAFTPGFFSWNRVTAVKVNEKGGKTGRWIFFVGKRNTKGSSYIFSFLGSRMVLWAGMTAAHPLQPPQNDAQTSKNLRMF